jgi:toxin ParE1/3/4
MSARVIRTPASDDDLFEIWLFIAQDNPDAATRVLRKIKSTLNKLERNPKMGRDRSELAPGLRSVACHPYVLFYRIVDKDIDLVRVLHGARDVPSIFESDKS